MALHRVLPLLAITAVLPLRAQTDGRDVPDMPIKMTPELALAVPFVQNGHDVSVKFPVLINRTTVLKPGMTLRNLYVPPTDVESENLDAAHMGNMAQSFSRDTSSSADVAAMTSNEAHEIERQRRVVWEVPVNFQLALAQLPTDKLHLIYSPVGDNRHLEDTRFDFYNGLLLGSPTGRITVLAVEVGSDADQAGIKPGDEIVSVGGTAMPADLGAFPQIYVDARARAKDNRATTYTCVVRGPSGMRTVNLPMPPTIKSMLMQGF